MNIFKEQWGDQLLHFGIGALLTYFLCLWIGLMGIIIPVLGWIAWEHSQYPNQNSKGYDDASIDRVFQELGVLFGAWIYI